MKKKKKLKWNRIILVVIALVLLLAVATYGIKTIRENRAEQEIAEQKAAEEEANKNNVSMTVTGDIISHDTILDNAETESGYDFKPYFSEVEQYLNTDIVYANLEGPTSDNFDYTGYPGFNAPTQLVDDLVDLGFNMFSTASNHSFDYGEEALADTSEYITTTYPEVVTNGYNESCDLFTYEEFTINEVDFTFVSYTDILNNPDPYSDCNVNMYTNEYIEEQLKAVTSTGDVNIISLHYGEENESQMTEQDYAIEEELLSYGFEIIIGTHPHVLKPIHKTTNSQGNDALVMYSLGNSLSSQLEEDQRLGVFLSFDIIKNDDGSITINNIKGNPYYMYYDWGDSGYTHTPGEVPTDEILNQRSNVKLVPLDNLDQYTSAEHEESMKAMYQEIVDASIIEE